MKMPYESVRLGSKGGPRGVNRNLKIEDVES